jgi:predicted O-methyltransferase YrrM
MSEPVFTCDWFSQNIGPLTEVLAKFKGKPDIHALEIGCFEGRGTLWLLENILTDPTSTITCIDTFEGSQEHKHFDMVIDLNTMIRFKSNTEAYKDRIQLLSGASWLNLKNLKCWRDIVYVDGSHMAPDVLSDMVLSWPLLKKGGVMFMDDYEWPGTDQIQRHRPKMAIDAFMEVYREQLKALHKGYSVAVEKL